MIHYKIYYNDGAYAETISYVNTDPNFIARNLLETVNQYNSNPNPKYHITLNNCVKQED